MVEEEIHTLINSIIIRLIRRGADISPDYSLTIHGYGTVTYEGNDNVGVKGSKEESIAEDKIMDILSEFKSSNFFSFNENYPVESPIGRPSTIISISLPGEKGEAKTKSVKYYHGDKNIPEKLKMLGEKIDKIVGSDKWVNLVPKPDLEWESSAKTPPVKKGAGKNLFKIRRGLPVKFIVIIVVAIVAAAFLFVIFSGIITFPSYSSDDELPVEYDPPKIIYSTTINEANYNNIEYLVKSELQPTTTSTFEKGEEIYVFYSFSNITHENNYSIVEDITIIYDDKEVLQYSDISENTSDSAEFYTVYNITTDESWDAGKYLVKIVLSDEVSGKSTISEFNFNLTEVYPKVITFTTASDIRAYKDYDISTIFERNDTVFIYLEYKDIITTDNNTNCDIYLKVVVTLNDVEYFNISLNKTTVGNNSHAWWFETNMTWPTDNLYIVQLYLLDRATNRNVTDHKYFFL